MRRRLAVSLPALLFAACGSLGPVPAPAGTAGTLLAIGGGLDDDSAFVYRRLVELASAHGPARIVIATAATGPEEQEAIDKTESLRAWAPEVAVEVVRRDTSTAETAAAFDRATAVFFTGGDQQRITARYRPDGQDSPEALALRRLLARGGVVAGASAGCAMLGSEMLLGGGSGTALHEGPRIGPGMAFVPFAMTDSHFFERDRLGRLVAALAASGQRFGIGVGEDACVAIDLASGELAGVTTSAALVVDARFLHRDGDSWSGLRARLIEHGDRFALRVGLGDAAPPPRPAGEATDVPIVEPGQNRQLASWRLLRLAQHAAQGSWRLTLEGWNVVAWPDGAGNLAFALEATE